MKFSVKYLGLLFWFVLILGVACGGSKEKPTTATPNEPEAETTPRGSPTGDAVTARIGPDGGSLATADGSLMLQVPAGTFAADTTLSIEPITNNAFGGLSAAFRLGPEGANLAHPVTLTYQAADSDLQKTSVQGMGIAYQDADGYWNWVSGVSYDDSAKTVSVSVQHFSDYAPAAWTLLAPSTATVKVSKYVNLHLTSCYPVKNGNDPNGGRGCSCRGYGTNDKAVEWAVNGVVNGNSELGTIEGATEDDATYAAPAHAPTPSTVKVSARLANGTSPQSQNVTVYSTIKIEDPQTLRGKIHIQWHVSGLVFDLSMEDATLTLIDDGPDETNYTLEGTASIAPSQFQTDDGGIWVLTDPKSQAYYQEYGFKVLKTTPPTVRWSMIAQWTYTLTNNPVPAHFPVIINWATRSGVLCSDFSDVPVQSLDNLDGSFDMECPTQGYGGLADWHFEPQSPVPASRTAR